MSDGTGPRLSAIDEARFGIRTARATPGSADAVAAAMEFCRANGVGFLIARCSASEIRTAQALEEAGCRLMDTLVYYSCDLSKRVVCAPPRIPDEVAVRFLRPGDEAAVRGVAAEGFRGYTGHYHADPRLDPALCDETYASWAERCCEGGGAADAVLVVEWNGALRGFVAIKRSSSDEYEIALNAISPELQGKGVYRALIAKCIDHCRESGATRVIASTQLTNIAMRKVWERLGFEPLRSYYTFHRWFDAGENEKAPGDIS